MIDSLKVAKSRTAILKLDSDICSVGIDLNAHTMTRVELVPKDKLNKTDLFKSRVGRGYI